MKTIDYVKELDQTIVQAVSGKVLPASKPEEHDCKRSADSGCAGCKAIAEALK